MTCVVGVVQDGRVWLGGDALHVGGPFVVEATDG